MFFNLLQVFQAHLTVHCIHNTLSSSATSLWCNILSHPLKRSSILSLSLLSKWKLLMMIMMMSCFSMPASASTVVSQRLVLITNTDWASESNWGNATEEYSQEITGWNKDGSYISWLTDSQRHQLETSAYNSEFLHIVYLHRASFLHTSEFYVPYLTFLKGHD